MEHCKIIAVGDNVCDKYLSRGKMYPGGQCVNTCVYVKMNNMESAYLGKYGDDEVAACVQDTLKEIGIDDSHCRRYEGENGFALVTLKETDRVFLGSNKGGIAKEHDFGFTKEDLEYIKGFHLIYTNLNSYIEKELPVLYQTGVPVAYDFSTRWTDEYLKEICPYVTVAIMSCAHLTDEEREKEMRKAQSYGVKVVLGTIGEDGSYVLYNDKILYAPAVHADDVIDTMGAGDSYFSAFLCSLLETSKEGKIVEGTDEQFILVNGKAILITAERKDGKFETELTLMEKGKVYNVPKECWFYSITQKDTKMVYVQDSGCSMENSDFCDLSEEEIKKIQEEARHLFA